MATVRGAEALFAVLDELVRTSRIEIDRQRGIAHPKIPSAIYPLDYGYLTDTVGGDGDGIDVFVGSRRGYGVVGLLVTADPVKRDSEIKVLVDCTTDEVAAAHHFVCDVLEIGGLLVTR